MSRLELAKPSKFTRGEKCIFIHLILTFGLIIVSVIIYFAHVCSVRHAGTSYLNTRRSSHYTRDVAETTAPQYLPIGILYIHTTPVRVVCNTIHLRERWSIAPAHCVIIRTDPSLAQIFPKWRVKYRAADLTIIITKIKRSIAHPNFSRDDFGNDVGLLEHTDSVPIDQYNTFNRAGYLNDNIGFDDGTLRIVSWNQVLTDDEGTERPYKTYFVHSMDRAKCVNVMAPMVDLRSYEHCVTLRNTSEINLYHGAALLKAFDVIGLFSWGERQEKVLPFVILHITEFKDWLQEIISNDA